MLLTVLHKRSVMKRHIPPRPHIALLRNNIDNPVLVEMPFTVKNCPELESKIINVLGPDRFRIKGAQETVQAQQITAMD